MRSLDDAPACSPQPQGLPLLLDGPLSFVVIIVGIIGNVYCISVLYRTSINIGMLVSLTALAIWDVILLLASLGHHSLWATLHYFGMFPWLWDTYKVALDGLLECAHLTSTWMLLQVSATRFLAVSRPFHVARSKGRRTTFAKVAIGLIRMPLLMTIGACLVTIPCSFEYVLRSCEAKGVYQFEREENSWAQSTVYFLVYRTLLLAFLKTFGPFTIIAFLTVNTLRSMRKSMNSRASILKQQGKGLLFEVDKDKTKSLQTISTLLLGKFLILRCWPTFVAVMRVLLNFQDSPDVSRAAEFMLLLNSATNSFVFVVIKSAFETRRLKRIRTMQRQLVMMHAEQVLSIGRMLAVKHDSDVETSEESSLRG